MTATQDLDIVQGQEFSQVWVIERGGERMLLSDWSVRAEIRTRPNGDLLLRLTPYLSIDPEVTVGGVTSEGLRVFIPPEVTRLVPRKGQWDLFLERPGSAIRLFAGEVRLTKAVTARV